MPARRAAIPFQAQYCNTWSSRILPGNEAAGGTVRGLTWQNQSKFTDPGAAGAVIDELPADLAPPPR